MFPDVFTNGDSDTLALPLYDRWRSSRLEIAILIEYIIGWAEDLKPVCLISPFSTHTAAFLKGRPDFDGLGRTVPTMAGTDSTPFANSAKDAITSATKRVLNSKSRGG